MSFIDVLRIFLIFQVVHYFWLLQRIFMENLKCVLCNDFSILFWSQQIFFEHSWSLLFPMFVLIFCFWSCICSLGGLNKVIACIFRICLKLDPISWGLYCKLWCKNESQMEIWISQLVSNTSFFFCLNCWNWSRWHIGFLIVDCSASGLN
jgi:hypothetical protein